MQQEAPRNASDRPETSSTATASASARTAVPARFRLDARTRRIGLEGVAAAKALLAEQAERRAAREAEQAAARAPRTAHRRAA